MNQPLLQESKSYWLCWGCLTRYAFNPRQCISPRCRSVDLRRRDA